MGGLALGDFDKAEVGEKMDASHGAALEMALIVKHTDDVTGADAVIFAEAKKKLHHARLGGVVTLGAGLELATLSARLSGFTRFARLSRFTRLPFATIVRGARPIFGDLFAFASG